MSSEAYVYQITKENAEKYPYIKPGLEGKGISDLDVTLGEAEGFSLFWISPTSGKILDGLRDDLPLVWKTPDSYMVTKEQFLAFLATCRKQAVRQKDEFNHSDTWQYLLEEYNKFEQMLNEFDWETKVLFMHEH